MTNNTQVSDLRGKINADGQLLFPYAWEVEALRSSADESRLVKSDVWGPVKIHRHTKWSIWVVSKEVPITGHAGLVCGQTTKVFPNLFFDKKDARSFARGLKTWSGHIDCTL